MREKKASFCTEADDTPTAENKIKETEREVITMTKNFTPTKADTQRPRLSKEEYAEKKRAEKDGVYQLADKAVKECKNIIIRLERENEYHEVENLVRESLWNVYRPVCLEHYVLKEILIFMEKADSDRRVSLASAIMDCRKARMHLSFCAKN